MRYIVDFHIHSKYSRSCSKNLTLSNMRSWSKAKGVNVLGTGDFTHPKWLKEIKEKLEPAEDGLFKVKNKYHKEDGSGKYVFAPIPSVSREMRFILSTEVCCIYKKGDMVRRLHLIITAPSIKAVDYIVKYLEDRGKNLKSDGRPILGMDAKEVLKMVMSADSRCEVIPAHIWTPWFSIFGSKSGFNSLDECFEELTTHIHAVETGLSSDPPMNWRLSPLDNVFLVSNSDAHGLKNFGREANVFDLPELNYDVLINSIRKKNNKKFIYTIEFFPEEGKYYTDGHRGCEFSCDPSETKRLGGRCPKCGKLITKGVLNRVYDLADRNKMIKPANSPGYRYIVPLEEIISNVIRKGKNSKTVFSHYKSIIENIGSEFDVLLDTSTEDISIFSNSLIAEGIQRVREKNIEVIPGYDGNYGSINIFGKK